MIEGKGRFFFSNRPNVQHVIVERATRYEILVVVVVWFCDLIPIDSIRQTLMRLEPLDQPARSRFQNHDLVVVVVIGRTDAVVIDDREAVVHGGDQDPVRVRRVPLGAPDPASDVERRLFDRSQWVASVEQAQVTVVASDRDQVTHERVTRDGRDSAFEPVDTHDSSMRILGGKGKPFFHRLFVNFNSGSPFTSSSSS